MSLEGRKMSEDTPIGLTLITKIVGLTLIIIGAATAYYSSDPQQAL